MKASTLLEALARLDVEHADGAANVGASWADGFGTCLRRVREIVGDLATPHDVRTGRATRAQHARAEARARPARGDDAHAAIARAGGLPLQHCAKCGLGFGEYMACEEPDCGPLVESPRKPVPVVVRRRQR